MSVPTDTIGYRKKKHQFPVYFLAEGINIVTVNIYCLMKRISYCVLVKIYYDTMSSLLLITALMLNHFIAQKVILILCMKNAYEY